ncbi:hypothetical protein KKD84_04540, partial [Patescibacteria group bacterium]|nr:hypothetical protein [Patescibacteria group bacterium]
GAAIAVNQNETIKNEAARRINFTSYFSVSYDSLQERTKEEFVQYVKGALAQVASNINYTLEKDIAVDSMDAHALEFELTQQGADFAVLMVLVYGDNGDVWAVSFNTVKEKWDEYKPMFYQTADSFRLK